MVSYDMRSMFGHKGEGYVHVINDSLLLCVVFFFFFFFYIIIVIIML